MLRFNWYEVLTDVYKTDVIRFDHYLSCSTEATRIQAMSQSPTVPEREIVQRDCVTSTPEDNTVTIETDEENLPDTDAATTSASRKRPCPLQIDAFEVVSVCHALKIKRLN